MDTAQRRIVVTGAASGIGLAVARVLAEGGARVGLLDRDAHAVRQAAAAIGPAAHAVCADVADEQAVGRAIGEIVGVFGALDGVVNCAGVDLVRDFDHTTTADWQRVFSVNVMGPVHVCQAALEGLRRGHAPAIVNVASAAGLKPLAQRTAYCSSKAALVMFGKALATDLAADGIRVNTVCPGIVDTPMLHASVSQAVDPHAAMAGVLDRYLIKRPATVQEVAAAVAFLLADGAGYITGSTLAVDGGRSFH